MLNQKNKSLSKEIQHADWNGESVEVMKDLYLRRNVYDIDPYINIYRIFQTEYLLKDIKNSTLTFPKISPKTWDDDLENPLLNKQFKYDDGSLISLNGLVDNSWGISWTEDETDSKWRWESFSHGVHSIRIKVNLYKLLDLLIDVNEKFYMLKYYAGKVSYHDPDEIKAISKRHYSDFLTSQGQHIVQTLLMLNKKHASEQEVRIIYNHQGSHESEGDEKYNLIKNNLCLNMFSWKDIIDEVLFSPSTLRIKELEIKNIFRKYDINCTYKNSEL